jgi:hypothetical protein
LLSLLAGCGVGFDRQILVGQEDVQDAAEPRAQGLGGVLSPDAQVTDAPETGVHSESGAGSGLVPIVVPWSTGFENAPGDSWIPGDPSCYATAGAAFQIVTSPVHGGQHAAAFSVNSAIAPPSQTRCMKQGVLPTAAYYGAWYYVPAPATNVGNWNLLHFQGGDLANGASAHGLWDVSLANAADGTLETVVYDFLRMRLLPTAVAFPTGTWVHLEVFLRRAADGTGEFTLRRDGQVALDLTGLATDDSKWGQWFVGNYASALSPPSSTVYVDDVTIDFVSGAP